MRLRPRRDDDWEDGRRARPGGWRSEGADEGWTGRDRGDMPVPGGSDGNWPADEGWAGGNGYRQEAGGTGPYAGGYADQAYDAQGYGAAARDYGEPRYGQAYGAAGQQYGDPSYAEGAAAYGAPGYGGAGYGDPGYGDPGQGGYGQQAYNGTMGSPPWDQPNSVGAPGADSAAPGGGWNGEFPSAPATAQYGRLPAQEADLPPAPEFTPASAGPAAGSSGRPYGRLSIFTLLDDKAAEFDRLAERAAEGVRTSEPDTLVYVIHVVPKAPMQRIIYEIYRDRAAFEHHEQQAHINQFVADRRSCVLATNIIDLRLKYAKVAPLQGTPQRGPRALEPGNRPAIAADGGWAADSGDGRYPPAANDRYAQTANGGYPAAANGQYTGAANGYSGYSEEGNGYQAADGGQYTGAANGSQYPGGGQYPGSGDGWFQPDSGYPQDGSQYQEPVQGGRYLETGRLPESGGRPGGPQAPDWDRPSYRGQR